MPHPSNLPEEEITPQVWFAGHYTFSMTNEFVNCYAGGQHSGYESVRSSQEGEASSLIPLGCTVVRIVVEIYDSSESVPVPMSEEWTFRVNGEDKIIFQADGTIQNVNIKLNKGDVICYRRTIAEEVGDPSSFPSAYIMSSLVLVPDEPNTFIYCPGNGAWDPGSLIGVVARWGIFHYRDFHLLDEFGNISNVNPWQLDIVSVPGTIVKLFIRVWGSIPDSSGVSNTNFGDTTTFYVLKGIGSEEEIIGNVSIDGVGEAELQLNEPISPGEIWCLAVDSDNNVRPKWYVGTIVKSSEQGRFMICNGNTVDPQSFGSSFGTKTYFSWTGDDREDELATDPTEGVPLDSTIPNPVIPVLQQICPVNLEMNSFYLMSFIENIEAENTYIFNSLVDGANGNIEAILQKTNDRVSANGSENEPTNLAIDTENSDSIGKGSTVALVADHIGEPGSSGNDGLCWSIGAKVILPSDIVNHPRGRLPGSGNQRNLRLRSIIDRL